MLLLLLIFCLGVAPEQEKCLIVHRFPADFDHFFSPQYKDHLGTLFTTSRVVTELGEEELVIKVCRPYIPEPTIWDYIKVVLGSLLFC